MRPPGRLPGYSQPASVRAKISRGLKRAYREGRRVVPLDLHKYVSAYNLQRAMCPRCGREIQLRLMDYHQRHAQCRGKVVA